MQGWGRHNVLLAYLWHSELAAQHSKEIQCC